MKIDQQLENELRSELGYRANDTDEIIDLLKQYNKNTDSNFVYYSRHIRTRLAKYKKHRWFKRTLKAKGYKYKYVRRPTLVYSKVSTCRPNVKNPIG